MGRNGWLILATILLLLGVGSLFLEGISYVTRETVVDIGPLEVTAEDQKRVALPLWLSFVLAAAGATALVVGLGRSRSTWADRSIKTRIPAPEAGSTEGDLEGPSPSSHKE